MSIKIKKILLLFVILFLGLSVYAVEFPRWVGQPIYVYVPDYGSYGNLMVRAFQAWQDKSDSLVRFRFVESPNDANIVVEFVDFVSNCSSAHAVGCTETMTRGKNYYKSYVTIGTKEYKRSYEGGRYQRKIIDRTKDHIYGVMLHEAGHSIGLGHSESKDSIMYPYDLETMQYLTEEDMRLLYNKYH